MEKEKASILRKWWFWVCVVLIVIVLCFNGIAFIGFNMVNSDENLSKLAKELQTYHNDIVVFQSTEKNNIIVECNFDDIETEQSKEYEIGKIVGEHTSNLSTYDNIQLNFNIKSDSRIVLNVNPKKQEIDENIQTWILNGSSSSKELENEIKKLEETKQDLQKEIAKLTETKTKATTAQDIVLTAGNYVVGEDIKVGKYNIIAQSGSGNVYIPLKVNETMGTTNDKYYLRNYNNVSLESGDTIEISGKLKVKFQAK